MMLAAAVRWDDCMDHGEVAAVGLALLAVFAVLAIFWALPVVLGVRTAKRKGYNPLWMLFGIHPVGAWVAFIVLACLDPRRRCQTCGAFVDRNFLLCPYCLRPPDVVWMPGPGQPPSPGPPPPGPPQQR